MIFDQQMAPRIPQPGSLTPTKAFAMAEELADQLGLPLVVVDPNGIWNPVWGELYRSTGPRAGWHERDAGLKPTAVLLKMVPVGQRVVGAWGLTGQFPLAHDPEKACPDLIRDVQRFSCANRELERDDDSKKCHPARDGSKGWLIAF